MEFRLRPWEIDDLDSVAKCADNPNIFKFMSDEFPRSQEQWRTFIGFASKEKSILYLAIVVNGQAVGGIGISPQKGIKRNNAELGYWIGENYWGHGIMTRAIREIVKMAFDKFSISRIFATPFETNLSSHKILEKNGFKLEARFKKTIIKNGEYLDELVYAIRRNEVKF